MHICMVIPYQTIKFKSANFFVMAIRDPTLIPANISSNIACMTDVPFVCTHTSLVPRLLPFLFMLHAVCMYHVHVQPPHLLVPPVFVR